jgi:predicted DNA-binding protein
MHDKPTTIRFNLDDRQVLKALSASTGLAAAQIIRLAIRQMQERLTAQP